MHGENRDTDVDNIHIELCHILGNGPAAAGVDFSKFARLPDDILLIQDAAHFAEELGGAIRGIVLSACTGVFAHADALVEVGAVVLIHAIRECGVKGRCDVGTQALAAGQDVTSLGTGILRQILNEIFEVGGVEAGVTV